MRILQVVTDTDRRGAQVFATDLHDALTRRGHTVGTVALAPGRNEERLTIEVLGRRRRGLGTIVALRRRLREVDVAVAHGSATASACAAAALGLRVPFVYRQISDVGFWASSWLRRTRVRAYLSRAGAVVALAEQSRRQLLDVMGLAPGKLRIVPNGVPVSGFASRGPEARAEARTALGLAVDRPTVAFVGALVPEKGADLAIEAIATLDAQLLVVGDGPERPRLVALAARVAPGQVLFLGSVPDPEPAYRAADAVVLPSRGGDTMPAALIEAGFCGLPAVTTQIGAIPEVVRSGVTGFVVPPNDLGALRDAIARVLGDPALAVRLGEAARAFCVSTFEIDVVARSWEQVLGEVLACGPRSVDQARSTER